MREQGVDEVLVDRAIWGCEDDRASLDWELTAGAVTLALLERRSAAGVEDDSGPPAALLERVRNDGLRVLGKPAQDPSPAIDAVAVPGAGGRLARTGFSRWLAAAAIVAAAFLWWTRPAEVPGIEERVVALESGPEGALRLDWQPGPSPLRGDIRGRLVWSHEAQEGYMRFAGLPVNDPAIHQYQLWIFDAERSEARPVDGGVFDVPSAGEVLIPIHAKLRVHRATMFAVTVERPGGVVVSDREHIVAVATT